MIRRVIGTSFLALFMLLFIAACGLLREPEEASGTIEAIPLALEEEEEQATVEPATPAPAAEEPVAQDTATEETGGGIVIFTIDPLNSEVRFEIDEDLRGQRNTVIGVTDQVAGELGVDFDDLSQTQAGVIQVNARTLVTDNNFRNRAIANEILDTGPYEFIIFTPTSIDGLPGGAAEGETVSFTITGDLTIRDITTEVVFAVQVTIDSPTQLSGTATAIVTREDYGLTIPSVPNVANVEQEVELYIDFVANSS